MSETADPFAAAAQALAAQAEAQPVDSPTPAPEPAPAPAVDPFAAAAQDLAAQAEDLQARQADQLRYLSEHSGSPERAAQVLRYHEAMRQTGSPMSLEMVDADLDGVKRTADARKVDWDAVNAHTPDLAQWALGHGMRTAAIRDDVANLSGLAWALKAPVVALDHAVRALEVNARQVAEYEGWGSEENRAKIREGQEAYVERDYGADSLLAQAYLAPFRMAPFIALDTAARFLGGAGGALLGPATAAAGSFGASAAFNHYMAVGPIYWQLSQLPGMDPETARRIAMGAGAASGLLMAGAFGKVSSALPPVAAALKSARALTVEKALASPTISQATVSALKRWGEHELIGASLFASQSAVNQAAMEWGKKAVGEEADARAIGQAAWQSFKTGLVDLALMSATGPARELYREVGRIRASEIDHARVMALADSAEGAQALEQLPPQERAELLAALSQGSGHAKEVWVTKEAWDAFWAKLKLDPAEAASRLLGDGGRAYAELSQSGWDLRIPIAQAAQLAKGKATKDLVRLDARLDPDAMSGRELAQQDALMAELAQRPIEQAPEPSRRVYEDYYQKAREGGKVQHREADAVSKQVAAFYETMAGRLTEKTDAWELYQRSQLAIDRGGGKTAGGLPQAERLGGGTGPEASRALTLRLLRQAPGERELTYYRDPVTGLLNARAFARMEPADRPQVGHISVEGTKWVNDTGGGHGAGDALLQMVARALAQVDPEAAKVGGDFLVRVKDQAELNGILERVRELVPEKGFGITGKAVERVPGDLAATLRKAGAEHGALKEAEELAGRRAQRGEAPLGLADQQAAAVAARLARGGLVETRVPERLRQAHSEAGLAETFREVYTEPSTGLLSADGFWALPRKAAVASIDLNGLKYINRVLGEQFGDTVLERFGKIVAELGGAEFDFAHLHGDEYAAQHDDPAKLEAFLEKLQGVCDNVVVTVEDKQSKEVFERQGLFFGRGIGADYDAAETALNTDKSLLTEAGLRGEAFDSARTGRIPEGPGSQAALDQARERGPLGERPGDIPGGGARQDWAGSEELGRRRAGEALFLADLDGGKVTLKQPEIPPKERRPGIDPELKQAGSSSGDRGRIVFSLPEGGKPRSFRISLLKADKSTLLHETSHYLSEVLGDLATSASATPALRADYEGLLKWMGHASHEERLAATRERIDLSAQLEAGNALAPEQQARLRELQGREEKFAYAWEQYLAEGQAPSRELSGPFARFKVWLTKIYRGIRGIQDLYHEQYGRNIELSDDVRGIFDRLLASEDQIAEARRRVGATEGDAWYRGGMDPTQQAQYDQTSAEARAEAERRLVEALASDKKNAASQELDDERARLTSEVEGQVDADPVGRALRLLVRGEMRGADGRTIAGAALPEAFRLPDGRPLKIDYRAAAKELGEDALQAFPDRALTMKGGASPEDVAALLGFTSAKEMAEKISSFSREAMGARLGILGTERDQAVRDGDPFEAAVSVEVQRRMMDTFGPALLDDPGRLGEEALKAAHNTKAAQKILLELRHLVRLMDPSSGPRVRQVPLERLQVQAERLVGERKIRDLRPDAFLRAERSAARAALELASEGKLREAYDDKERQLFNALLYDAARERREAVDKLADQLSSSGREAWRKALGKASPVYRDVHDSLLEALGLKEPEQGAAQPRATLENLLVKMLQDASGATLEREVDPVSGLQTERLVADNWDSELVQAILQTPRSWQDLTADQLGEVYAAVRNIRKMANEGNFIRLGDRALDRTVFLEEAARTAAKSLPEQPPVPRDELAGGLAARVGRDLRLKLQSLDANLLSMETMADMLGGGDRNSVFRRLLVDGYLEARTKKEALAKKYLERITELWERLPEEMRRRRYEQIDLSQELPIPADIETLGNGPSTRAQLWMIALNMGNAGNKQRLLDGYGWTEEAVMQVLRRELKAEEWQWVQGVWDSLEDLYPEIAAVHEAETGLRPEKIRPTPVQATAAGDLRGGYFPARYDPRVPSLGFQQTEGQIAGLLEPGYRRPVVQHGHSKKRAKRYTDVVSLDWSVLPSHVAQVLHDIAFRQYVRSTATVFLDKRWQFVVQRYLGEERAKQFVPWLQAVANAQADAVPAHIAKANSLLGWLRNRAASQAIGHSLGVALGDLTNPLLAAASGAVKTRYLALATAKLGTDWAGLRKKALEASPELQHRAQDYSRKLREQLGLMGGAAGLQMPALRAARESAFYFLEQTDKLTGTVIWLARYHQSLAEGLAHEVAVKDGDAVVRRLFPAHADAEKASWLRDQRGLGSLLMFYGFMNKVYNLDRSYVHEAWATWHDGEAPAKDRAGAVAQAAGQLLATALVVGAASELLSGRGKEEDESWGGWLARKTLLSPFTTLPFVGQAIEGLVLGKQVSIRQAPALSLMQNAAQAIQRLLKAAESGDVDAAREAWDVVELLGIAAGVPTRQARKTLEYAGGLATGSEQPRGPGDVASGLVYGKRRNQPANLGTAAQDLVSGGTP